jgi:hypothetical protein
MFLGWFIKSKYLGNDAEDAEDAETEKPGETIDDI